jgi:putative sporulation protein YtaF
MLSALLLVLAVCIDAFATSVSYGMGKIKIPFFSALIISLIGTSFLAFSIFCARILSSFINPQTCVILSVILLIFLGITNLFQNSLKSFLRKHKGQKNVSFSLFDISFVIEIFLDETKADIDNSKTLSPKEALALAIALSLDSLASGFSAGLSVKHFWEPVVLSLIIGVFAVIIGSIIGRRISRKTDINLSWISGVVLISLAIIKII